MDFNALNKLSYGVYIVSTKFDGKLYGQIATTVMQVTSEPPAVIVAINKQNLTHDAIQQAGGYNISVLDTSATLKDIALFGFRSGRDIDKFKDVEYNLGGNGLPIVTASAASCFECLLTSTVDVGTHSLFIAKVTDAVLLRDTDAMTYDYYHKVIKGKSSKYAPSYTGA
jgi:ferric-chelate reductase [NAD(P)H]